ncbi:MAG: hypothetical protein IIW38_01385 [Alistipes sp.]|nr:hypothetical protein [Alistipes sp.]MBQ5836233.1 hypothetical protein [Alistipes sp.]
MRRFLRNIAIVMVAMLTMTGCFKKVTTNTTLIVKTLVESKSGERQLPTNEAFGYIYYTDKEEWTIESYADAEAKVITHIATGEKLTVPDVESEPYTQEGLTSSYIAMPQTSSPALVVVVYPAAQMYAYMWRRNEAENLYKTYLTLIFHTWKTDTYQEGNKPGYSWTVVPPTAGQTTQP